jgi:hypothetical protein
MSKERIFAMLEEVWERTKDVPAEELEQDIEQALVTLRQERREQEEPASPASS